MPGCRPRVVDHGAPVLYTLFGQGSVLQHVLPQSGVPFFVNQVPGGVAYPIMLGVGLQPLTVNQ